MSNQIINKKTVGTSSQSLSSSNNKDATKAHLTTNAEQPQKLSDRDLSTRLHNTQKRETRREHYEDTHLFSLAIKDSGKTTLSEREISESLHTLSRDQRPWPAPHHNYFEDENGSLTLRKNQNYQGGIAVTMYEADPNGTHQYTTQKILNTANEPLHHDEAFATANKKGISQSLRDTYPIYTYHSCRGIPQDRGHGIDFILTMPEANHSSIDSSNYTPQNEIYNRSIRMLLVKALVKEGGLTFKEINIYSPTPEQLVQKTAGKYTGSKKVETNLIDVPEGFLFMVYDSSKKIRNIYYFPNFVDYAKIKATEGIDYTKIPALFEIEIPIELLWGTEINCVGTSVYDSKKSDEEISKEVRGKGFLGFRMLSGRYPITFKESKAEKWMPVDTKQILKRTLALKVLNEMAENEITSIEYKLSIIKTLLSDMIYDELGSSLYDPAAALLWLQRVKEQVANESTIEEKLELYEMHETLESNHPKIYISLGAGKTDLLREIVIQEKNKGSSIEVKLQLVGILLKENHKLYYLEKIETHIMADLDNIDMEARTTAIKGLNDLADYYSGFVDQTDYDIPLNYKKAHELYQKLFENFSNAVYPNNVRGYANHLKRMFISSPECMTIEQMRTYAKFFHDLGHIKAADFWDKQINENVHAHQGSKIFN